VNVVDSSGWLEYFADGPSADFFAKPIQDMAELVVPMLSIVEVFKRVSQQRGEGDALQAIAVMQQGTVVEITVPLALDSARLSLQERIPLADSIMVAIARARDATLWTQDPDLEKIEGVKYIKRKH